MLIKTFENIISEDRLLITDKAQADKSSAGTNLSTATSNSRKSKFDKEDTTPPIYMSSFNFETGNKSNEEQHILGVVNDLLLDEYDNEDEIVFGAATDSRAAQHVSIQHYFTGFNNNTLQAQIISKWLQVICDKYDVPEESIEMEVTSPWKNDKMYLNYVFKIPKLHTSDYVSPKEFKDYKDYQGSFRLSVRVISELYNTPYLIILNRSEASEGDFMNFFDRNCPPETLIRHDGAQGSVIRLKLDSKEFDEFLINTGTSIMFYAKDCYPYIITGIGQSKDGQTSVQMSLKSVLFLAALKSIRDRENVIRLATNYVETEPIEAQASALKAAALEENNVQQAKYTSQLNSIQTDIESLIACVNSARKINSSTWANGMLASAIRLLDCRPQGENLDGEISLVTNQGTCNYTIIFGNQVYLDIHNYGLDRNIQVNDNNIKEDYKNNDLVKRFCRIKKLCSNDENVTDTIYYKINSDINKTDSFYTNVQYTESQIRAKVQEEWSSYIIKNLSDLIWLDVTKTNSAAPLENNDYNNLDNLDKVESTVKSTWGYYKEDKILEEISLDNAIIYIKTFISNLNSLIEYILNTDAVLRNNYYKDDFTPKLNEINGIVQGINNTCSTEFNIYPEGTATLYSYTDEGGQLLKYSSPDDFSERLFETPTEYNFVYDTLHNACIKIHQDVITAINSNNLNEEDKVNFNNRLSSLKSEATTFKDVCDRKLNDLTPTTLSFFEEFSEEHETDDPGGDNNSTDEPGGGHKFDEIDSSKFNLGDNDEDTSGRTPVFGQGVEETYMLFGAISTNGNGDDFFNTGPGSSDHSHQHFQTNISGDEWNGVGGGGGGGGGGTTSPRTTTTTTTTTTTNKPITFSTNTPRPANTETIIETGSLKNYACSILQDYLYIFVESLNEVGTRLKNKGQLIITLDYLNTSKSPSVFKSKNGYKYLKDGGKFVGTKLTSDITAPIPDDEEGHTYKLWTRSKATCDVWKKLSLNDINPINVTDRNNTSYNIATKNPAKFVKYYDEMILGFDTTELNIVSKQVRHLESVVKSKLTDASTRKRQQYPDEKYALVSFKIRPMLRAFVPNEKDKEKYSISTLKCSYDTYTVNRRYFRKPTEEGAKIASIDSSVYIINQSTPYDKNIFMTKNRTIGYGICFVVCTKDAKVSYPIDMGEACIYHASTEIDLGSTNDMYTLPVKYSKNPRPRNKVAKTEYNDSFSEITLNASSLLRKEWSYNEYRYISNFVLPTLATRSVPYHYLSTMSYAVEGEPAVQLGATRVYGAMQLDPSTTHTVSPGVFPSGGDSSQGGSDSGESENTDDNDNNDNPVDNTTLPPGEESGGEQGEETGGESGGTEPGESGEDDPNISEDLSDSNTQAVNYIMSSYNLYCKRNNDKNNTNYCVLKRDLNIFNGHLYGVPSIAREYLICPSCGHATFAKLGETLRIPDSVKTTTCCRCSSTFTYTYDDLYMGGKKMHLFTTDNFTGVSADQWIYNNPDKNTNPIIDTSKITSPTKRTTVHSDSFYIPVSRGNDEYFVIDYPKKYKTSLSDKDGMTLYSNLSLIGVSFKLYTPQEVLQDGIAEQIRREMIVDGNYAVNAYALGNIDETYKVNHSTVHSLERKRLKLKVTTLSKAKKVIEDLGITSPILYVYLKYNINNGVDFEDIENPAVPETTPPPIEPDEPSPEMPEEPNPVEPVTSEEPPENEE